ncbi:hypothetical protein OUZ56_003104 [Daphnia magna]|uniref:Uncharacterized protein n=1 Tax=Daphnia magna TaxID=35525 RepID=A0ABR0A7R1_9CRUS|nr:hypothetical protein OUZ56_003104 [Daphnia magna]
MTKEGSQQDRETEKRIIKFPFCSLQYSPEGTSFCGRNVSNRIEMDFTFVPQTFFYIILMQNGNPQPYIIELYPPRSDFPLSCAVPVQPR